MSASRHSFDICARDRRSYSSAVTKVACSPPHFPRALPFVLAALVRFVNCQHGTRKLEQTLCYACRALRYVWAAHCVLSRCQGVRSHSYLSFHWGLTKLVSSKQEAPHPGSRTPFDCCALTFQPFTHPVCARNADGTGNVFDLVSIIPWLKCVPLTSYLCLTS